MVVFNNQAVHKFYEINNLIELLCLINESGQTRFPLSGFLNCLSIWINRVLFRLGCNPTKPVMHIEVRLQQQVIEIHLWSIGYIWQYKNVAPYPLHAPNTFREDERSAIAVGWGEGPTVGKVRWREFAQASPCGVGGKRNWNSLCNCATQGIFL